MRALRKRWKVALPHVRPLDHSLPNLPKSSSFVLRWPEPERPGFVFLWFQPSARTAGHFTVNVILSATGERGFTGFPGTPKDFDARKDGTYRIGRITYGKDKWWRITPPAERDKRLASPRGALALASTLVIQWSPTSYELGESAIFAQAIEDLTRDVRHLMTRLAARS